MPYVHQRTWVQLAPKIRGLSLKESQAGFPIPKGMGQAGCPSIEQLMGITDPSDPCQSGGTVASGSPCPSLDQLMGVVNPNDPCQSGSAVTTAAKQASTTPYAPPVSATSLTSWIQANQTTVLMIGAGLFGLALVSGMGRR
jgi:hypothetical protein